MPAPDFGGPHAAAARPCWPGARDPGDEPWHMLRKRQCPTRKTYLYAPSMCCLLFPHVGLRRENLAVLGHHAEEVTTRVFHDPPGLDGCFPTRPEFLQALYLGLDIVGLNVQVDAARVVHP